MASKPQKKTWDEEIEELYYYYHLIPKDPHETAPRHKKFKFWDVNQKYFHVMNKMLVAAFQTSNLPEQFMTVLPNTAIEEKKYPIFMGLEDKTYSLSCVKSKEGKLQIQLEERDVMDLYKNPKDFKHFTFYSKTDGGPETCSFESAEFPGWFISTSSEPNQPIILSQKGGPENILFYFAKK